MQTGGCKKLAVVFNGLAWESGCPQQGHISDLTPGLFSLRSVLELKQVCVSRSAPAMCIATATCQFFDNAILSTSTHWSCSWYIKLLVVVAASQGCSVFSCQSHQVTSSTGLAFSLLAYSSVSSFVAKPHCVRLFLNAQNRTQVITTFPDSPDILWLISSNDVDMPSLSRALTLCFVLLTHKRLYESQDWSQLLTTGSFQGQYPEHLTMCTRIQTLHFRPRCTC